MPMLLYTKDSEIRLMQQINELRDASKAWEAIHFHLSELLEQYKSDYQIKIAVNLIHDLLKSHDGSIFSLSDSSIVVLCHNLEKVLLEKLVFQMRYLYMDDPLSYQEDGKENPGFCTQYNLQYSWKEFAEICAARMTALKRRQPGPRLESPAAEKWEEQESAAKEAAAEASEKSALISHLAAGERHLKNADLHAAIRRQPVCAVLPDMNIRRVFDELYINIAHLRQILKSDVDFLSNRWLFKYMTLALDERMMELIRQQKHRYLGNPVSINFNVETLLSPQFAEFDAAIDPAAKISIVFEIPVIDVFADMAAFTLARSEMQKLGYRICLDGLTVDSFSNISREKLGADLIKVQWNADMHTDLDSPENTAFKTALQEAGTNRVILCRCDNRAALQYGQALGISLFQGRYLDSVLNPTAKVEN